MVALTWLRRRLRRTLTTDEDIERMAREFHKIIWLDPCICVTCHRLPCWDHLGEEGRRWWREMTRRVLGV